MNPISAPEKQKFLEQILNSPEFKDSPRYQELLKYLAKKSIKGGTLKEIEIAQEFFGKDASFDPTTDTTIRSYVSNLRKKLEHYYLTSSNNYSCIIEIPKGQYHVNFSQKSLGKTFSRNRKSIHYRYAIIIGALLLSILLQGYYDSIKNNHILTNRHVNPLWTEFMKNSNCPTLLVIGDYFFMSEKNKSEMRTFLRDPRINNAKEFNQWTRQSPQKYEKYEISDISYIGAGASLGIKDIISMFGGSNENLSVKLASQIKWGDLEKNNVVFIGSLKNLYLMDTLLSRTSLRYSLTPNRLSVYIDSLKSYQSFELSWRGGNYQKDYSIIVKLMGSNDNTILLLTGFSEIGITESIELATDSNLVTKIEHSINKNVSNIPSSFELVSEAEGVHYTVLRSSIKYFHSMQEPPR